eukprot:scaffold4011_cov197-Ochromonas_danica.AAC.8
MTSINLLFIAVLWVVVQLATAQIPCDDAYGQHCPEASGFGVGDCLKTLDAEVLSADCKQYINWHDTCKEDILKNCPGSEYTGDALACLTEWNKPEALSADCIEALPKKQETKKTMTAEEKKKAAQRRK